MLGFYPKTCEPLEPMTSQRCPRWNKFQMSQIQKADVIDKQRQARRFLRGWRAGEFFELRGKQGKRGTELSWESEDKHTKHCCMNWDALFCWWSLMYFEAYVWYWSTRKQNSYGFIFGWSSYTTGMSIRLSGIFGDHRLKKEPTIW